MCRKLVLIPLLILLLLAAGLLTAFLVYRHATPVEFQRALADQPIAFPADEAAHFQARTEWWYYTGFLSTENQQIYGFELVFFKAYLPDEVRVGGIFPLRWTNNPICFAHFAISDLEAKDHVFFERANFPRFWEAGARADRYEVWNSGWRAWGGEGEHHLRASAGQYSLRLDLDAAKPPVLHGPDGSGVVEMGEAGTSYYTSYTDLRGVGLLDVEGKRHIVDATAWMDHQWGSWDAHQNLHGWDWFSLRLDDDSQAMLFRFRDGGDQTGTAGTWIAPDGQVQHLTAGDFSLEVLDSWTSPETTAAYPVKWHLTIPSHGVDATIEATFPEQELPIRLGPVYWEGSVTVDGTVRGMGFVELTGYAPGAAH